MENFKAILAQQRDALKMDIAEMVTESMKKEVELDEIKTRKSQAQSALRSIEKKLEKLAGK